MPMLGQYDLERLLDAIRWQESRGNQNAVSPKGARTAYGIMPATAADPGYGVQPRDIGMLTSDENAARDFSRDYLKAMYDRTGSPDAALAAYNGGLGRGLAFKRGASVPTETANYVPSVIGHYNNGVPAQAQAVQPAQTPRMRWDALMQKFNPISTAQAAEGPLGAGAGAETYPRPMNEADLTAPGMEMPKTAAFQTNGNQGVMQQGFRPNDPGVLAPDLSPQPAAAQPSTLGPPTDITPPAADGPDPYFEKLQSQRTPRSKSKYGWLSDAGMAIGAGLMTAAGVPVNASAVLGSDINRRNLDLEERKADVEQSMLEETYKALMQNGLDQGLAKPEAARRAFILSSNPKLADELGMSAKESYGVTPEFFQDPDTKQLYTTQYGSKGTQQVKDLAGNVVTDPKVLNRLQRDTALKKMETATEVILYDRDGNIVSRTPKEKQLAAEQEKLGEAQASAKTMLPGLRSTSSKIIQSINDIVNDPALPKFTGLQGWIPTISPEGRAFKKKLEQLDLKSFMIAFESLKGAGAITDREGAAATQALARLNDLTISDEGYVEALKDFANEVDRLQQVVQLKAEGKWNEDTDLGRVYPELYGNAPAAGGAPSGVTIRRVQ